MSDEERGGSSIEVLLDEVTGGEVEDLAEKIADLLVAEGLGCGEDILRSMLVIRGYEWPASEEDVIERCSDASMVIIPADEDNLPEETLPKGGPQ